jgi:DNA-binding transcriptional ArsR family regulator
MARQSVSKHLAVLEAANLVTTQRRGREKLHYLNAEPIRAIADRWIRQYDRAPEQPPHRWVDWHDAVNQP